MAEILGIIHNVKGSKTCLFSDVHDSLLRERGDLENGNSFLLKGGDQLPFFRGFFGEFVKRDNIRFVARYNQWLGKKNQSFVHTADNHFSF